jgi:demethoxyubiquinone hydroxylase (CLK1/Coq7/Cat5 family)
MEPQGKASSPTPRYDVGIIRPQMVAADFRLRGEGMAGERLGQIKKALRTLHTLETMAQTVYRFQLTRKRTELNRQLVAAMCNEMTHLQDFQVKLYEYGWKPSKFRWAYWMVGWVFGYVSRLMGIKRILKTGIWVETKAVDHYAELLETVEWDDDTRKVVEKDQADEGGHISRWRTLLEAQQRAKPA